MKRKKIITGLSVLGLLYVLFRIGGYLLIPLFQSELSYEAYNEMQITKMKLGTIELFFSYGFNIACGVYLFIVSKEASLNRILWLAIGSIFGFNAIILFYVFILAKHSIDKGDSSLIDQNL